MKLNQVIAVLQTIKADSTKARTQVYHLAQKSELFEGLSRTYEPNEEDGFEYPPESKPLQIKGEELLEGYQQAAAKLFDMCATQDWSNTKAIADVVIDGVVILKDAPIAYLLFLEKQLQDLKSFVSALPTQDISEEWVFDQQRDCWATIPKHTTKTKRVVKPVVLYEATVQHPAQVKEVSEDIPEGKWKTIKFSGAFPTARINVLVRRLDALTQAVIFAREQANSLEVQPKNVSSQIFGYLFGK